MPSDDRFTRNTQLAGIALGALYLARYVQTWELADTWTLLDDIDLAIHEAGHIVFLPFGEFMMTLGGSLFQLLVPAMFVAYFAKQRQWYSASFLLLWLGQSCFNVSYYIADARARVLPLLSDDPTSHDWTWLLLQMNLLNQDRMIGNFVRVGGLALIIGGIVGCVRIALYRPPPALHSFASSQPMVTRQ